MSAICLEHPTNRGGLEHYLSLEVLPVGPKARKEYIEYLLALMTVDIQESCLKLPLSGLLLFDELIACFSSKARMNKEHS
jgi:hypothetical protein